MDRITASRVFIAIVERGSLTAAANSLNMSRSMVTRYLSEMEEWVNARLLHRSTRKISLTAAGDEVFLKCQQLLDIADDVSANYVVEDAPISGKLRISCAPSLAHDVLTPIFQCFLEKYPDTSIELHISNHTVNLIEEGIDLAIRITNDLDPNLIARKLGECDSVICASPSYIAKKGTPKEVNELSLHNCLTYSHFGKSVWTFFNVKESVLVSGNLNANDSTFLLRATLQGMGISMQPYYSACTYIKNGELIHLLTNYEPKRLGIYGVYSSRRHMSHSLRALLDVLVEMLPQFQT